MRSPIGYEQALRQSATGRGPEQRERRRAVRDRNP